MARLRIARAAALLAGLMLGLAACNSGGNKEVQYQTVLVDKGAIVARVSATGTLSALVTVQVGSQVSGRVKALEVDFNSRVRKGQLLAQIDPALFQAARDNARANKIAAEATLAGARVQAANAKLQYDRSQTLLARGIIAQADFDTAKATYDAAVATVGASEGSLEQAKAQLSQAELNLSYTEIISPTNGIVISRNVDIGQTVAASLQAPVLFLIAEDLKKMQVDTSVAEADVGKLSDGMDATFTVDAFPYDRFKGTIRQIRNNSTTVQNVVTYDAVIDVDNPDLRLRPGMTANVTVVISERPDAVRISNAALRYRPIGMAAASGSAPGAAGPASAPGAAGGRQNGAPGAAAPAGAPGGAVRPSPGRPIATDQRTVWRLAGGKLEPVRIRIGITDGTLTEVIEGGLKPGDSIVTDQIGGASGPSGFRPL